MKLYEIPTEVEKALDNYLSCFDENGEVVWDYETAQKTLLDLQNKQTEALEWLSSTYRESELRQEAIDSEISRLSKIRESEEKRWVKLWELLERLFAPMYEGKTVTIGNFKLSYRKSERVIIDDASLIPESFLDYKPAPPPAPDKTKIKKAISDWEFVTGARIQVMQNFNIK